MAQITLPLIQVYSLEAELNGAIDQKTGEKITEGFLKEKLNLGTKYRLTGLAEKLSAEKKKIDTCREELIKKLGTEKDGSIFIEQFEEEGSNKFSKAWIQFQEEFGAFLSEEIELEYSPIPVAELEKIDSESNYSLIFKLVKDDER
jgi:hypothetical protein